MVLRHFILACRFYEPWPIGWIGAKDISGLWSWAEPVNTPLTDDPVWIPLDPNVDGSLCMVFYYKWFADEPCISSLALGSGVFCEHYDIPLFIKQSETT